MNLDSKKTKIGAIGCFLSGILFIGSSFFGIPIEIAYGLFACSYAVKEWGRYDRDRKEHAEAQGLRKEAPKVLDKAFFRITAKGKKVPIMGGRMEG